jgi:NAD(P)-dependent dehydrogenase (short-subunit alcohol dehydrogenase family)/rhamnose utilization protein RhaD (predicted bifunctional aldolase and dehydrogenase)
MDKALADLIRISRASGANSALVQGGSGNTSVKTSDGKFMYIKASGAALKDMNAARGWRRLRLATIPSIIQDKTIARGDVNKRETEVINRLLFACDDNITGEARPSVEAHLHCLLDKVVIHLHPVVVGAYVSSKNGRKEIEKLFAKSEFRQPPLWVPYTEPGFMLGIKVSKLVSDYQKRHGSKPAIIFLEKHGLIVSANDADTALRILNGVISLCSSRLAQIKAAQIKQASAQAAADIKLVIRKAVFDATGRYTPVSFFAPDKAIISFMNRRDAGSLLAAGVLNPGELVYAGVPAMLIKKVEAGLIARRIKAQIGRGQKPAAAFLVKDAGLFVAADMKIASIINDITTGSLLIRMYAAKFGGVIALTKRQRDFIINWETEACRNKQTESPVDGCLKGQIAIVTGAGSGLGRSIAIGLVRAGAMVGFLDIDEKAARQASADISKELPHARIMVLKCNVTDEMDVDKAYQAIVRSWGGLDILVNAAGVAPAGPLVDLAVDKWRFALEVNLTGYFIMAKAAAKVMLKQGIGGNIINLSSKSGLEASRDNTPYNATKAGEIHIARGWALELGGYGIRVNSVCPGNVFEGSKIWNPEYIKICAKKYGIKPKDVIAYYVQKTALNREIKGQDIADAVIFLCSDSARKITGQTLVVDSGQVMVR